MAVKKKNFSKEFLERRFKKGQSGNPEGARLRDVFTNDMKKLTLQSYREIIQAVVAGDADKLKEIAANPKTSILELGIINSIFKATKAGDYETIEKIVSRVIGKIPDEVNIKSDNVNTNLNSKLSKDDIKSIVKELKDDV